MRIFSWNPDLAGASVDKKTEVNLVKFGNGYEQRQKKSIHGVMKNWSLSKTAKEQEINEIDTFLSEHEGVTPFLFTIENKTDKYVCSSWSKSPLGAGIYRISFGLRQVVS